MEVSQFNVNCTDFTAEQLKNINLAKCSTAILCVTIVVIIIVLLVVFKAYKTTLRQFYLCLIIGTLVTETVQALGIEHQFQYVGQADVCKWFGFLDNWTSLMVFVYAFGMILYLLCFVISQVWRISGPFKATKCYEIIVKHPTYSKNLLKGAFVSLPIFLSLLLALIPFIDDNYGLAGPWCWIRSVDENCNGVGLVDQMIYFSLYELVGIIGIIAIIVFSIIYFKLVRTCAGAAKTLLKQTLVLMVFQLVYILIVNFQLSIRLSTALTGHRQQQALWFIHAISIPVGHLIFPLGFLICFYSEWFVGTFKKMFKCLRRTQYHRYLNTQPQHEDNHFIDLTRIPTFHESHHTSFAVIPDRDVIEDDD